MLLERLEPLRRRLVGAWARALRALAPYLQRARAVIGPWATRVLLLWQSLSARSRWIVTGAALTFVCVIAFTSYRAASGCSSRADVELRVADVTADLQSKASRGEISLITLASRIKRINEAAKAYERDADAQNYCDALSGLRADGIE